jgi:hypothetical protein
MHPWSVFQVDINRVAEKACSKSPLCVTGEPFSCAPLEAFLAALRSSHVHSHPPDGCDPMWVKHMC